MSTVSNSKLCKKCLCGQLPIIDINCDSDVGMYKIRTACKSRFYLGMNDGISLNHHTMPSVVFEFYSSNSLILRSISRWNNQ